MRYLALLAIVLLAACLPAAPAAAAPPPACGPGQIQVRVAVKKTAKKRKAARTTCRTVLRSGAPRDPVTAAGASGISGADMRGALPRRLRKRFPLATVRRVEQAVARRSGMARAATRARMASAGDCSTPPAPGPAGGPQTDNGATVTTSGGSWGRPGGATWGVTATVTAEHSKGGASATQSRTTKTCVSWDTCPDAEGRVAGTGEFALEQAMTAEQGGLRVTTRTTLRATVKMVAHVGGDGRVKTFDWNAEGTAMSRGEARQNGKVVKVEVGPTVRVVLSEAGVDPRGGGVDLSRVQYRAWGAGGSVLDGTAEAALAGVEGVAAGSVLVAGDASKALLGAERVWYDEAACLDVVFDPQPAQAEPNAQIPVGMKVRAKDGQDVEAAFALEAIHGSVAPATGTTPATATWTAPGELPEGRFPTFDVVAVSKRGRALGTHTARAPKSQWWRVTFEGAGEYHRHEPRSDIVQLWSEIHFRFSMVSEPVRLPPEGVAEGYTGARSTTVSGDAGATRVDGGGTTTCASPLDGENEVGMVRAKAEGDGFSVRPTGLSILQPIDRTCVLDDMLIWMGNEITEAMTANVHVSRADLEAHDRIERAVEADLAPYCYGGTANGDWPCTQSVRWQGRVILERVTAP